MNLNFNICEGSNCSLVLTDTSNYLPEGGLYENYGMEAYKQSECDRYCVVIRHTSKEDKIEEVLEVKQGNVSLTMNEDGWVSLIYIVIPNKERVDRYLKTRKSNLCLYFSHDSSIYKYIKGIGDDYEIHEVQIDEILNINPECTTFSKFQKEFFGVCQLEKCYINYCNKIIDSGLCNRCATKSADTELIYNRDLIWMILNVIKYSVEKGDFSGAQHILEEVNGCNGLCNNNVVGSSAGSRGCGCKH